MAVRVDEPDVPVLAAAPGAYGRLVDPVQEPRQPVHRRQHTAAPGTSVVQVNTFQITKRRNMANWKNSSSTAYFPIKQR